MKTLHAFYVEKLPDPKNTGTYTFLDNFHEAFKSYKHANDLKISLIYYGSKKHNIISKFVDVYQINQIKNQQSNINPIRFKIGLLLQSFLKYFYLKTDLNIGDYKSTYKKTREILEEKFIKLVDSKGIDLVVFSNQFELPSIKRPYIYILWDTSHCQTNFFEWMESSNIFYNSVNLFIKNSFKTITGNRSGKEEIIKYYKTDSNKIRIVLFLFH